MALDFNNARLILWLRANGIPLGDVLTVGRLGAFLSPDLLASDARRFGISPTQGSWLEGTKAKFCEVALLAMGASTVEALDYSDYEGATVLHDLNKPLPPTLEGSCDLLFDSGSLEHVFNVPEALDSYAKLVRPGGWMVLDMPANGCCGHGFYQFSPELFFQYFEGHRGCRVAAVFCVEDEPLGKWFLVPSPASIRQRVYLHGSKALHIYVIVQRLEAGSPAPSEPVQFDYDQAWRGDGEAEPTALPKTQSGGWKEMARSLVRRLAPIAYWRWSVIRNAARNRSAFTLNESPHVREIDPFTWRLPPASR